MSWVTFENWICLYADEEIDRSDIEFHRVYNEGKKQRKYTDFIESRNNYNKGEREYPIFDRRDLICTIKGVEHYFNSLPVNEIDFQTKGKSKIFCVATFLQIKNKFVRGDIIAVFTAEEKYLFEPYKQKVGFFEHLKSSLTLNIHKDCSKYFSNIIINDIRKKDSEYLQLKKEEEENQRRNRQEELERLRQIEENERNSKLRMQEEENRNRSRLLAEKERLEHETEEIKKRIDIQTMSAIEEKNLTAELLEMRERIARIDEETSQKRINSILDAFKSVNSNGLKVK